LGGPNVPKPSRTLFYTSCGNVIVIVVVIVIVIVGASVKVVVIAKGGNP